MPNYVVIDAPSNLGLRPTGVETLPIALKSAGLLTKLGATYAGRVTPLPYHAERDPATQMRNADAIRLYAQHLADMGLPVLDGLAPIGGLDHSPREYILISSIVPRTALLALLMLRRGARE